MQKILGLDIAGGNIIAAVFAVEGDSVSTLEHYSIPLKRKNDTNEDSSQEVESSFFINLSDSFKEVIRKIQNKYSRSFLIIPPYNYLSTDIELPFFNPKAIEKILELEIQDLVSLDVNEFHIAPYIFDDNTKKDNAKVHIGMLPKKFMNEITSEAKKVELEPYIITTRATSLSALYYLYKELNKNSAIVSLSDNILSITASCDGNVCYDRAVLLENKNEYVLGFEDFDTNLKIEEDIKEIARLASDTYKIGKVNSIWKQKINDNKKVISSQPFLSCV